MNREHIGYDVTVLGLAYLMYTWAFEAFLLIILEENLETICQLVCNLVCNKQLCSSIFYFVLL